jgi:type II secretory pathway pseudopilin PulG
MKNWFENNVLLLIMSAFVFIGGYLFLRLAYNISDKFPFTQEIILVVLGTLATILITAMLLNKQTEVELQKEQSIKFIELKTETYQRLIDMLEEISLKEKLQEKDFIKLQFNSHRLAIFASAKVLDEYENFLSVLNANIEDRNISSIDREKISYALAKLTIYIREDLIGELDSQTHYSATDIEKQILTNAQKNH